MLVNKYAWSKLGGECAVRLRQALIIRTSFGRTNFRAAFTDQWTSRRAVSDAAPDVLRAVESGICGVLHVGGGEPCWSARSLDPAKEIGALSIKDVSFSVPVDTSLDTSRFSSEVGN